MERSPIVLGLAAVFAGITVLLSVLAFAYRELFVLLVALPFGAATYLFWYHATGRLAARAHREHVRREPRDGRRERGGARAGRGRFGAGPREEWSDRGGRRRRNRSGDGDRRRARSGDGGRRTARGQQRRAPGADPGPTDVEARRVLGVDAGADEDDVRRAYRRKVKEVHPDTPEGSEEAFKRVTDAYDRLTE